MFPLGSLQSPLTPATEPSQGEGPGLWSRLVEFAGGSGNAELAVALCLVAALLLLWLHLRRFVLHAESRREVSEYLLAVEQALAQDHESAERRLTAVLAKDPENHGARFLLAKTLMALGKAAQAHKEHLLLQQAFGVQSPHYEVEWARTLLANGLPDEACEALARALAAAPDHEQALLLLFQARLQTGEPESAIAAMQKRMRQASSVIGSRLAPNLLQALSLAFEQRLRRGDRDGARALALRAMELAPTEPMAQRLELQCLAIREGSQAAVQALLASAPTMAAPLAAPALPVSVAEATETQALSSVPPSGQRRGAAVLPMDAAHGLALLLPRGPFRCRQCGSAAQDEGPCLLCGSTAGCVAAEPELWRPLATPQAAADLLEANAAHVRRVAEACTADADDDARRQALDQVLALGARAVPDLLQLAVARKEPARSLAITALQRMGPGITPDLFAASEALDERRILPGSPSLDAVARVVTGFGRAALPFVTQVCSGAKKGHRSVLIDFILSLLDPAEFRVLVDRFPPVEILHRLNRAHPETLQAFLAKVEPSDFLVDALLREPALERDEDLFLALGAARLPEALLVVLKDRGPSRALVRTMIGRLCDPALRQHARDLLVAFGPAVHDALLSALQDPDLSPDLRAAVAEAVVEQGSAVVERICAGFGPEPSALDEVLFDCLVRIGPAAIAALCAAYARPDWVQRVTVGFVHRSAHRRMQIARVLASIGGPHAQAALVDLQKAETHPDLKLQLTQALHRLERNSTSAAPDDQGDADGQDG